MAQKVRIEFENGSIINLELYPECAPETVENFVALVKDGFYDGVCFHRVIPDFMVQGGGFEWENGLSDKKAPKTIKGEFKSNGFDNDLHHAPGVISMARTMFPNSASSQFFICVADCGFLDGQYAAFGKVTDEESLKTAIEISQVDTGRWGMHGDVPTSPVVMKRVYIVE